MKKVLLIFFILLLPFSLSLSLSFNSPSFIWNYVSSYQTDELMYWKAKYTKNLIELIEDYFPILEKSGLSLPITSNVEV
ncbi:MAG: Beta-lactamase domain protein [Petrotoga mobilis]|nr:MAG: Beta-lactamase domain protein [Petrotoga mobilis]